MRATNDLARHCNLNGLVARQGVDAVVRQELLSGVRPVENLEEYGDRRVHVGCSVDGELSVREVLIPVFLSAACNQS